MKIGLDFDGVIANYLALKARLAHEFFDVALGDTPCDSRVVLNGLLTQQQYRMVQSEACTNPARLGMLEEIPGAIAGIRQLIEEGNSLRIITSRDGSSFDLMEEWLDRKNVPCPRFSVGRKVEKTVAIEGEEAFLDDGWEKLVPMQGLVRLLYHYAPQPTADLPPYIQSVPNWPDFIARIHAER